MSKWLQALVWGATAVITITITQFLDFSKYGTYIFYNNILTMSTIMISIIYLLLKKAGYLSKLDIDILDKIGTLSFNKLTITIVVAYAIYYTKIFIILNLISIYCMCNYFIIYLIRYYILKENCIVCNYSYYIRDKYTPLYKIFYCELFILPKVYAFILLYILNNNNKKKQQNLWNLFFNALFSRTVLPIIAVKMGYRLVAPLFYTLNDVEWDKKAIKKWPSIYIYVYILEYILLFKEDNSYLEVLETYKIYQKKTNGLPLSKALKENQTSLLCINTGRRPHYGIPIGRSRNSNTAIVAYSTHNSSIEIYGPNQYPNTPTNIATHQYTGQDGKAQDIILAYHNPHIVKEKRLSSFIANNGFETDFGRSVFKALFITKLALDKEKTSALIIINKTNYIIPTRELVKDMTINNENAEEVLKRVLDTYIESLYKTFPKADDMQLLEIIRTYTVEISSKKTTGERITCMKTLFGHLPYYYMVEEEIANQLRTTRKWFL